MAVIDKNNLRTITIEKVWRKLDYFLAFGYGLGKIPCAPGTFGTLGCIPIYLLIVNFNVSSYFIIVLLLFVYGLHLCKVAEQYTGFKDDPAIVWDEIVGMLLVLGVVPMQVFWLGVAFVLFRLFDIVKPWPINLVEKIKYSGLSIMLDDIIAGLYSIIVIKLLQLIF